jgi:hypothetical protein
MEPVAQQAAPTQTITEKLRLFLQPQQPVPELRGSEVVEALP